MIEIMRSENLVSNIQRIKKRGGSFIRTMFSDGYSTIVTIDTSMGENLKKQLKSSAWEEAWCEAVEEQARTVLEGEFDGPLLISVVIH